MMTDHQTTAEAFPGMNAAQRAAAEAWLAKEKREQLVRAVTSHCVVCNKSTGRDAGRCTNRCCGSCHARYCTPGGTTTPGHNLNLKRAQADHDARCAKSL
jgi:hypothetical protein